MLVAKRIQDLDFTKLMAVYADSNIVNGRECYRNDSAFDQIRLAEEDFYRYLVEVFFRQKGALYFILTETNEYVSALRVEPYQDGVLIQALETRPDVRRRGFAKALLMEALRYLGQSACKKVYSHITKSNIPSLKTHLSCGFAEILDYAKYVDGTVSSNAVTMCKEL